MIQFNLLPDVKIEYIKTQYRKRLVIGISLLVTAVCLALFVILFLTVRVAQKQHLKALDKDIKTSTQTLKSTKDLDKVLTVQNQLASLPSLHNQKVISSRLYDYLVKLTPVQATISEVTIDYEAKTLNIKGNADSLNTVNKFVDTIKFTDFKVSGDEPKEGKAFSNVVLQSFEVEDVQSGGEGQSVSYEIALVYEPAIFAVVRGQTDLASLPVTINVPKQISTRSETQKPSKLFTPQPKQEGTN